MFEKLLPRNEHTADRVIRVLLGLVGLSLAGATISLAAPAASALGEPDATLQAAVDSAVAEVLHRFAERQLRADQMAVTVVDLTEASHPTHASHRGTAPIYPASVIKLFYLAAAHRWIEDGRLEDTDELRRALRDMIVDSSNDAAHYVVDLLTGTTSGPELPQPELEQWQHQRNSVNRYFESLGYTDINVNKKPWCEGPYGRESQAMRAFEPRRNLLTTEATAHLMVEIATGMAVTRERSTSMMQLLRRELKGSEAEIQGQARFTGPALPAGSRLWSKAGWTSETRHDAAYVELPDGRKFVLVVFTEGQANERGILHTLARLLTKPMRTGER